MMTTMNSKTRKRTCEHLIVVPSGCGCNITILIYMYLVVLLVQFRYSITCYAIRYLSWGVQLLYYCTKDVLCFYSKILMNSVTYVLFIL